MAVKQPHYSLKDLAKLDDRLEAHLDGLRIAGDEGWEICKEELFLNEPGEVFTAAVLAFESRKDGRIDEVLKTGLQSQELIRSLTSALGWIEYKNVRTFIESFWFETDPLLQQAGIAASAIHRKDPPDEVLTNALGSENINLKARALKATGELGKTDMLQYLQNNFRNDDPFIRFSAARSACLIGSQNAPYIIKDTLNNLDKSFQEEAVKISCRKMNIRDASNWIGELKGNPEQLRLAITGAGAIGDPANIPWLIEMMKIDQHARIAGESFTMITGVDLAYENLDRKLPAGVESGPTEDPKDDNVEMDPDENLPMPDAELIQKWWTDNKNRYKNGIRYLAGQPISQETMKHVLRTGLQRQRSAAAVEMVMLSPGEQLFNVKSPGFMQKKILFVK